MKKKEEKKTSKEVKKSKKPYVAHPRHDPYGFEKQSKDWNKAFGVDNDYHF